jgi:hypothetical protein
MLSQQVGWLGGVFVSILKVKGSNLMGGVVCGQPWYVDRICFYQIPVICA